MKEYLIGMMGSVLLSAILTAILPNGKTTDLIKSIAKMVCVLAIVSPMLQFFYTGNLSIKEEKKEGIFSEMGINQQEIFIEYYSEMRIQEAESRLEEELLEKYKAKTQIEIKYKRITELLDGMYNTEKIKIIQIHIKMLEKLEESILLDMFGYVRKNYCSEVLIE